MSMMEKWRSSLQGRATSYWLNAQADAQLAQDIIHYLKNSPTRLLQDNRFNQLLELSQLSAESKFFLVCCAFALWEINGRMDYEVAHLYAKISGFAKHLPSAHFSQNPPAPFPLLTSWLLPVVRSQRGLHRFLQRQELALTGSTEVFIQAVIAVQEINITHNQKTINSMARASSPKTKRLKAFSELSPHPHLFLQAAQHTQQSAIFWDRLFIRLLKVSQSP